MRRLPWYSLAAGAVVLVVLLPTSFFAWQIPGVGLGALAMLPLAAAIVDAVRMRRNAAPELSQAPAETELREWFEEQTQRLDARRKALSDQSLALHQWLQFPDAISFDRQHVGATGSAATEPPVEVARFEPDDPLADHDAALFALIEDKTKELFENIKNDAYRQRTDTGKVLDTNRLRADLLALISDVAAIYRPTEDSPLLRTNVEAIARATGRASLRLLVAIENLPGGLQQYDIQTIYNAISRAVMTYGMYQAAKPYLDVASNVFVAGRLASSTNPLTFAAWWAAGKATSYGATQLGKHVIDQQAVGLIRQLVEIVAVEVASLYSPMVRYRDAQWIYGVELVQLASEVGLSPTARLAALKQVAALNLRDEYGRVSLLRQLATGKGSRPDQYRPAESLAPAVRMKIVEQLESFVLTYVLKDASAKPTKRVIDRWQTQVSERLEIQFRASDVDATEGEQTRRCVWSLMSYALEHLEADPEDAQQRLLQTKCWQSAEVSLQQRWKGELRDEPPFLFQPPDINPNLPRCNDYIEDLIALSASARELKSTAIATGESSIQRWSGRDALQFAAYFLRQDVQRVMSQHAKHVLSRLFEANEPSVAPESLESFVDTLECLAGSRSLDSLYAGVRFLPVGDDEIEDVMIIKAGDDIIAFTVNQQPTGGQWLQVLAIDDIRSVSVEKLAGYLRNDCQITFSDASQATIPGSSLRGFESYFGPLL